MCPCNKNLDQYQQSQHQVKQASPRPQKHQSKPRDEKKYYAKKSKKCCESSSSHHEAESALTLTYGTVLGGTAVLVATPNLYLINVTPLLGTPPVANRLVGGNITIVQTNLNTTNIPNPYYLGNFTLNSLGLGIEITSAGIFLTLDNPTATNLVTDQILVTNTSTGVITVNSNLTLGITIASTQAH